MKKLQKSSDRPFRSERRTAADGAPEKRKRTEKPFNRSERPFSKDEKPTRSVGRPRKTDDFPFKRADRPFGREERPFNREERPSRGVGRPRKTDDSPFRRSDRPAGRPVGGPTGRNERTFSRSSDKPFNRDDRSYNRDERPFNREERPSRGVGRPRKTDDSPFRRSDRPAGRAVGGPTGRNERTFSRSSDKPFNRDDRSYNRDERPFNREERPSRGVGRPRKTDDSPFRRSDRPAGRSVGRPAGRNERTFSRSSDKPFSRDDRSFNREERPYNREERSFRNDDRPVHKRRVSPAREFVPKRILKDPSRKKDDSIRLNKFIANSGICSRREADDYITAGLITVNGEIITQLGSKIKPGDDIRFNGERLKGEEKVYIVMNKPKDFVTTTSDSHAEKTVMDLIDGKCPQRVYPVGRLDKGTTGVLLLTNDGELTEKLTHPSQQQKKIYHVFLDKNLKSTDFKEILEGMTLEDGEIHADALSYIEEDQSQLGLEIHSGRNRIVRRIFEHLGYTVKKLDRVYFAGLTKKNLKRGQWRFLTQEEVNFIKMGSLN